MLQMARHEGDKPLTITSIAELEGLTTPYVGKLMHALRQGDLVKSIRGQKGGYHLARPAKDISLDEIFSALDGHFFEPDYCERYHGQENLCVHTTECSIRSLWARLDAVIREILRKTSLADLSRTERFMGHLLQSRSDAAADAPGGKP
jgi:Rrf2 family protein